MQGDIKINTVHVGMIGTNCYIVYKDNTESLREAIIIDPGDDADKIYDKVEESNKYILLHNCCRLR